MSEALRKNRQIDILGQNSSFAGLLKVAGMQALILHVKSTSLRYEML